MLSHANLVGQHRRDRRVPAAHAATTASSSCCRSTTRTAARCCTRICRSARASSSRRTSCIPHTGGRRRWRASAPPVSPACRRRSRCCSTRVTLDELRSLFAALPDAGRRRDVAGARRSGCARRCRDARLFVMYGQTEATARLTYLPPEDARRASWARSASRCPASRSKSATRAARRCRAGEAATSGRAAPTSCWATGAIPAATARGAARRLAQDRRHGPSRRRRLPVPRRPPQRHDQDRRASRASAGHRGSHRRAAERAAKSRWSASTTKCWARRSRPSSCRRRPRRSTPMQVKAHCRARLATYKIPKYVEFVPTLPRTASGKVRRARTVREDES